MKKRGFPKITVSRKAEKSLRGGHPWVYGEEVLDVEGTYARGDLVDVVSEGDKYLGSGFINDFSKIRIRLLSRNPNDRFDSDFFRRRLQYALSYRRVVMGEDFGACRLVFGEADGLPGMTVDRYGKILVTQTLSYGIECRKEMLYAHLVSLLSEMGETTEAIYERNDVAIRELEGMEQHTGFYPMEGLAREASGNCIIREGGLDFWVDYVNGQKTGYFLDQKYNRPAVGRLCRGMRFLDLCTHTGGFALHAAASGASSVTAVDISPDALEVAARNAALNRLEDRVRFVQADVFEFLEQALAAGGHPYDFINLDPPAFTKSRSTLASATRGYRQINAAAMRLLPRGGYFSTCSCSHFMTNSNFCQMLHNAAEDAGVSLRQIEERRQSPDHPILWNVPETDYLKLYIFQVV